MTEDEARTKLHALVPKQALEMAPTFIEEQIAHIYNLGNGDWDERAAQKHVMINLGASLLADDI